MKRPIDVKPAALAAGMDPDGYAVKDDRYNSLDGAFSCLLKDCSITGITVLPEQTRLGL